MERAFIITEESNYFKALKEFESNYKNQSNNIFKFLKENGIKAEKYYLRGDGLCNVPFKEENMKEIVLGIIPTDEDNINFDKMLTKSDKYGLRYFKKRSLIGKKIAKYCVDKKLIINLSEPFVFDYLKTVGYGSFSRALLTIDNTKYALKVKSDSLREDDNPKGFIPIKLSEFYKYKESKTEN